jgi:hypothetical protein
MNSSSRYRISSGGLKSFHNLDDCLRICLVRTGPFVLSSLNDRVMFELNEGLTISLSLLAHAVRYVLHRLSTPRWIGKAQQSRHPSLPFSDPRLKPQQSQPWRLPEIQS